MTMPTSTWKTENDLCRCCHTEAEGCSFLSILEPVYSLGSTEVFVDILKSCLDIDLLWVKGAEKAMRICNTCIQRLRDANNFKKQVQLCEARFKEINYELLKAQYSASPIQIKIEPCFDYDVKKEFPISPENENDGSNVNFDNDNDDIKNLVEINVPVNTIENPKPKAKRKALITKKKTASKSPKKTGNGANAKKIEVASLLKEVLNPPHNHSKFTMKPTDYERDGDYLICKHCGKKAKDRGHITNHVKCEHYKLQKFMCPRCNEGFMKIDEFVTHKFLVHQIDDRSKCHLCDAVFNRKCQLTWHYHSFHIGKSIKCSKCDFVTHRKKNLYQHMFKHKTVKDFKCRFCDKAFLRKGTLNMHEKIHTNDRRNMCDVCGQAFIQKCNLIYHMENHHPEVKFNV